MAPHPQLATLARPTSLTDPEALWALIAGHTAAGALDGVALDWEHLPPEAHLGGVEAILQTMLFAGYPRTINAMGVARKLGIDAPDAPDDGLGSDTWVARGENLCSEIYGEKYAPLRVSMGKLHPALDRWMVEMGYGRVLSRPGLTPRQREFCVLAVLAGQNVGPQLQSHLHGALNVGATPEECQAVLDISRAVFGTESTGSAYEVWDTVRKRLAP